MKGTDEGRGECAKASKRVHESPEVSRRVLKGPVGFESVSEYFVRFDMVCKGSGGPEDQKGFWMHRTGPGELGSI